MKRLFFSILILISLSTKGMSDNKTTGARYFAMANASVALSDHWSAFSNQAGLALLKEISIGAYYENRYSNKELSIKSFCLNIPSNLGNFSGTYTQFGFDLYKESTIGISYSKALGKHLWAGLQFNQISKKLNAEYGSQSKYTVELGILAEISQGFFMGFHIANPTQEKFSTWDYKEKIPTIARFGIAWKLSNEAILSSEILKDLDSDIQLKAGIEYPISKVLFVRAGAHNHPNTFSMGLGFNYSALKTNLSFSKHPILGYTPSADISFHF